MKIDCQQINEELGVHCHPLSENTLLVSTPFCFSDNSAINMYVEVDGDSHVVTDDGNTLMRFYGIGMGENSRLATSLDRRAKLYNGNLIHGRLVFSAHSLREAYTNFLKTMIEIVNYELEHASLSETKASAINDVVTEIQRRNPGCQIERDISLTGFTGAKYLFPLKADDRVIAITSTHHQSTGSILRKVADIGKVGNQPPLVVIDDCENPKQGEREALIIETSAPCMLLSDLKTGNAPIQLKTH